ncbi:MAG TPA: hypothetical protein PKO25_04150 [Spirochaetota bacterium]|jgi:hypothetical protein|nr:hypothetical protein [Spirochaetota bacterium]OPZ39583.1 MAG: hypothetical protein BWY96_00172 [Spirochaetes bacterium ADurb.BinA120]HNU91040.1 hypothetical protein [Spirochaetota bacterium]HPI15351.1 hypothetical protein [Spirochaetota bacterium]HPO45777.1 hypothetical protein [Spirochaetota bacterium]
MKVVHVLKKIELIDSDIKDLRKMEKSLQRNKSFTTPIYLSIEKQINILLGERIKLLELRIDNPPDYMIEEIEGKKAEETEPDRPAPARKKGAAVKSRPRAARKREAADEIDADDIPLMTQDLIDRKIESIQKVSEDVPIRELLRPDDDEDEKTSDESIKLLDIALEKGTLARSDSEKEKRKVKFFKDNFPGGEY